MMAQNFYGYIQSSKDSVFLSTIDAETHEVFGQIEFGPGKELLKALDLFPANPSIKHFIVNIFSLKNHDESSNLEFCEAVKQKLISLNIQHYFISYKQILASSALIAGNFIAKIGEVVLMVLLYDQSYRVTEMEYTKTGYKQKAVRVIDDDGGNESLETLKTKIMGSCKPVKVIACTTFPNLSFKRLKKIMKLKDLVIVDADKIKKTETKCIVEIVNWMKNKRNAKYYTLPTVVTPYFLYGFVGNTSFEIFTISCDNDLPAERTAIVSKPFQGITLVSCDCTEPKPYQVSQLDNKCHRYLVKLKIDAEFFPTVEVTSISVAGIKHMPQILDIQMKEKIPVIGFFDSSSVICVAKDQKNYKFLDQWNGLYGIDLFINFNKEKPKYGSDTVSFMETDMKTVVYDLIKIMSMPANKIIPYKKWEFTFTENEENPVLIEFDNFDGEKKAASPAFLMAMLLRQHLKAIKEEIGEKPKKIGISLVGDFTNEERKRVEEQLREACKLIKIDCCFIEI